MTALIEFWNNLVLGQQIFLCIAVPATLLLVILIVMMLVGMGDDDVDSDVADEFDGEGDADAADGEVMGCWYVKMIFRHIPVDWAMFL